ncbi:MAG: hypothetical protein A3I89_03085 [Candidatus Harrisonbacteria bacterium RIFCSPLOWO2_02_FULL_41_11]|uniref:Uncharacterized protein n=1 Tax=Candidatus Harrisonbacteria bacterium RIFCSPHIGHO2_02_FULL_42_16 TaxID=1798404 RepID=A0A1G1ZIQ7_9BACT|nr:MAG: hypothetical protein A3B92_02535 [Candidatus Harrisonbacteria bacterium RIFCSPHIGHO2_02_FULL_42_16]OGY67387.1 MAG: hypothetical protein A3I89_03085 [Candidatus Harrisonbacteria bacterium RIFCSPLOWO2_02_FULL_41_11]
MPGINPEKISVLVAFGGVFLLGVIGFIFTWFSNFRKTGLDIDSLSEAERNIYSEAQKMLDNGTNSIEFFEKFFRVDGMLRMLWISEKKGGKIVSLPIYKWLQHQLAVMRKTELKEFEKKIQK